MHCAPNLELSVPLNGAGMSLREDLAIDELEHDLCSMRREEGGGGG